MQLVTADSAILQNITGKSLRDTTYFDSFAAQDAIKYQQYGASRSTPVKIEFQ